MRRVPAAVCVLVPIVLLVAGWGPLTHGHPAHLVLLGVVVLAGIAAFRAPVWLAAVLAVVLTAPLLYLQPFAATEPGSGATVLRPEGQPRAGLVFHPGARVDHRAYLELLDRVARQGFLVVVVKEPLDIALLNTGTADLRADHPDVEAWAVGGHSLGGVAAAKEALTDNGVRGLVLWASYPVDDLSGREGLTAWSIHGEKDGFTTPQDVEESKKLLPARTRFEQVPGAVHAFFGDYGDQPGDGEPATGRAEAQDRIVALTVEALSALSPPSR
ncbi:alpha/beta hydrolase [Lentzea sp.]|uniref:alpha/beta hydrolase n=1 Tax=Lentzea sp. TaxID=56099 RepID=UPI002B595A93|nr:alpha/beta hydrolase [Lentzea sp.]HUQ56974.1 alpha/beta hydrolase [Lentzea sp.]